MHKFSSSGSRAVVAGETFRIFDVPANASIAVHPGDGGSMAVYTMIDINGTLMPWAAGTVTASAADALAGPVALVEFRATDADGRVEWRY